MNQKNQKKRSPLPHNVLQVDFAKRVQGFIVRGHTHVGIGLARDYKLRDRFEDTYFILEGGVYVRLTLEIVKALLQDGEYLDFALTLKVTGETVHAKLDLSGKKSETSFDSSCLARVLSFMENGPALGEIIARALNGARVQDLVDIARRERSNRQPKRSEAAEIAGALGKASRKKGARGNSARKPSQGDNRGANRNSGKPRGDAPGGMGTLGSVHGPALEAVKGEVSRAEQARHGKKKAEAHKPTPEAKPVVSKETVAEVRAAEAVQAEEAQAPRVEKEEPTLNARQVRAFAQTLSGISDPDKRADFLSRISTDANRLAVLEAEDALRPKESGTASTVH